MKRVLFLLVLYLSFFYSYSQEYYGGIPAYPYPSEYKQPDGTILTIIMQGDEMVNWAKTMDGYSLVNNPNNHAWEYAILDQDGNMMSSGIIAHDVHLRTKQENTFLTTIQKGYTYSKAQIIAKRKAFSITKRTKTTSDFPTTGTVKMLVILVNFPNTTTTYTQTNFDNYMNQTGYSFQNATGSFKDYYLATSYNQLTVVSTVVGWVTAPNPHDYYGPEDKWSELARDAIVAARNAYPSLDFSQFDNNNDGYIDGIAIFHQGHGQEASGNTNDVWSHTGSVYYYNLVYNGKRCATYTMQPEKVGTSTNMITVGVMVHEFGHNLGLPDLYDTDYSSDGIGNWDVMAGGSWLNGGRTIPVHNAWSKYQLGWLTPVTLTNPGTYTLNTSLTSNTVYRINTQTNNEYFLLENRQKTSGTWNAYLPGSGMIIYHIDQNYINSHWSSNTVNDDENHQGVDIEEADGTLTTNNGGDAGDPFPGSTGKTSFTDQTSPNSLSWAGANTNKPITNITHSSGVVTFVFMGGTSTLNADFFANQTTIQAGQSVTFTDMSVTPTGTSITSWQWTFQGGTPSSYNGQNPPPITYNNPGTYTVSLTVTNSSSITDTEAKTAYITVTSPPQSQWITQYSGFTTQYRGVSEISIVDANTAWGIAIDGNGNPVNEFTRTSNGGQTWTIGTVSGVPSNNRISNICAISATKAWIAMYSNTGTAGEGGIFVTTNGGQSWTKQTTATFAGAAAFPNVVHFWNDNEGFCMGDPNGGYFEIYTTTNGGTTWTRVPQANIPANLSGEYGYTAMYDVVDNTIWFATNKGRVYKSTNKGQTWTVTQVPNFTDFSIISFNDANNGFAIQKTYSNNTLTSVNFAVTSNGGTSWTTTTYNSTNIPAFVYLTDMDAIPGVAGKWVGVGSSFNQGYGSAYTENFGQTWIKIDSGVQYISCKFLNNNIGWAGGFNTIANTNGIYKWQNLTNVDEEIWSSAEVMIYPNPATESINLKMPEIYVNGAIEIYNLLGKQIFTDRIHTVHSSIDCHNWEKGMYIIRLTSQNQSYITKILVK
ncbi:MAG: M6 family metalloprotease domain-containing protein [Bacteroidales bacterium]|nr:M6 family metalloprotease domain-containing protein [Bacteroidales bacterium]